MLIDGLNNKQFKLMGDIRRQFNIKPFCIARGIVKDELISLRRLMGMFTYTIPESPCYNGSFYINYDLGENEISFSQVEVSGSPFIKLKSMDLDVFEYVDFNIANDGSIHFFFVKNPDKKSTPTVDEYLSCLTNIKVKGLRDHNNATEDDILFKAISHFISN